MLVYFDLGVLLFSLLRPTKTVYVKIYMHRQGLCDVLHAMCSCGLPQVHCLCIATLTWSATTHMMMAAYRQGLLLLVCVYAYPAYAHQAPLHGFQQTDVRTASRKANACLNAARIQQI